MKISRSCTQITLKHCNATLIFKVCIRTKKASSVNQNRTLQSPIQNYFWNGVLTIGRLFNQILPKFNLYDHSLFYNKEK